MIYVQMGGRLGNQLFSYAVARRLQLKYYPNERLILDYHYLANEGSPEDAWVDGLADFNVSDYSLHQKNGVMLFEGSLSQKLVSAGYYLGLRKFNRYQMNEEFEYEKKWSGVLNKLGVYWYRTGYINLTPSQKKDKLVSGRLEDPRYFIDIRELLIKEFTPKRPALKKNEELYEAASNPESVCVSIRRGDFESNPEVKKLHGVCNKEYYLKAISLMRSKYRNPHFLIFSDDIGWARNNIQIPDAPVYYESGNDPVWEKLRMMKSCNNFIISNSTFSWWAQWLSTNPNKTVIAPSRWFNNGFKSALIEETMFKINV